MNAAARKLETNFSERIQAQTAHKEQPFFFTAGELMNHIHGCALNDRLSQKTIYNSFYSYAKSIADLYAKRNDDAVEIVNDCFLKMFKEMHRYKPAYADVVSSFKGWLRRILIHTAIDHFRRNHKHNVVKDLPENVIHISEGYGNALDKISSKEIMDAIQQLSPAYKTILTLYTIEDLTHIEISKLLGITVGASKSNLSKARRQLQKIIFQRNQIAGPTV